MLFWISFKPFPGHQGGGGARPVHLQDLLLLDAPLEGQGVEDLAVESHSPYIHLNVGWENYTLCVNAERIIHSIEKLGENTLWRVWENYTFCWEAERIIHSMEKLRELYSVWRCWESYMELYSMERLRKLYSMERLRKLYSVWRGWEKNYILWRGWENYSLWKGWENYTLYGWKINPLCRQKNDAALFLAAKSLPPKLCLVPIEKVATCLYRTFEHTLLSSVKCGHFNFWFYDHYRFSRHFRSDLSCSLSREKSELGPP